MRSEGHLVTFRNKTPMNSGRKASTVETDRQTDGRQITRQVEKETGCMPLSRALINIKKRDRYRKREEKNRVNRGYVRCREAGTREKERGKHEHPKVRLG